MSMGVSRGRGCLAVIRGLPASLVFPLSRSFLQMGAEWRGVSWPWDSWQEFSRGSYGLPHSPSAHGVLNLDLTPEMGETWRKYPFSRGRLIYVLEVAPVWWGDRITFSREYFERSTAVKSPHGHS